MHVVVYYNASVMRPGRADTGMVRRHDPPASLLPQTVAVTKGAERPWHLHMQAVGIDQGALACRRGGFRQPEAPKNARRPGKVFWLP